MSVRASTGPDAMPAADGPCYDAHPELALAALLQLLSRFPARRSAALAQTIASHFQVVAADASTPECLRACARRLVADWQAYAVLGELAVDGAHEGMLH